MESFRFKRSAFGLTNALGTQQRLVDYLFDEFDLQVFAYLDDVVVSCKDFDNHVTFKRHSRLYPESLTELKHLKLFPIIKIIGTKRATTNDYTQASTTSVSCAGSPSSEYLPLKLLCSARTLKAYHMHLWVIVTFLVVFFSVICYSFISFSYQIICKHLSSTQYAVFYCYRTKWDVKIKFFF